jgi:hypothetical protein
MIDFGANLALLDRRVSPRFVLEMIFFELFFLGTGTETDRWGEKVKIYTGTPPELRQDRFNTECGTKGIDGGITARKDGGHKFDKHTQCSLDQFYPTPDPTKNTRKLYI